MRISRGCALRNYKMLGYEGEFGANIGGVATRAPPQTPFDFRAAALYSRPKENAKSGGANNDPSHHVISG